MEYSNPEIPEGINTSKEHPLKEFAVLSGGLLIAFTVIVLILGYLAESLATYIPFSAELKITAFDEETSAKNTAINKYLQSLAERIANAEDLPQDMTITVRYQNGDTVNAFATLGGNIIIYRGLLEKLPDENSLAMVLSHEIAHIKHRHPIKGFGRTVVIGLAVAMIDSTAGTDIVDGILGKAGLLTTLKFSRDQEREADETGLAAVAKLYGHVSGVQQLYQILQNEHNAIESNTPEFFSTHPLTEKRIKMIQSMANQHGWKQDASITPLPSEFNAWLGK